MGKRSRRPGRAARQRGPSMGYECHAATVLAMDRLRTAAAGEVREKRFAAFMHSLPEGILSALAHVGEWMRAGMPGDCEMLPLALAIVIHSRQLVDGTVGQVREESWSEEEMWNRQAGLCVMAGLESLRRLGYYEIEYGEDPLDETGSIEYRPTEKGLEFFGSMDPERFGAL
jgi:hypothetical protein